MVKVKVKYNLIRKERRWKEYTQEEFAKMVGISRKFMGEIERGEKWPSLATLARIAFHLGKSIDYFVDIEQSEVKKIAG